jgi:hypothetical protein
MVVFSGTVAASTGTTQFFFASIFAWRAGAITGLQGFTPVTLSGRILYCCCSDVTDVTGGIAGTTHLATGVVTTGAGA